MQRFSKSCLFIFVFSALIQLTNCEENGDEKFQEYYNHLTYAILYSICWLFLIDISLIIVMHFKHNVSHIANHSFINMSIVITQLINFIIFWKKQSFSIDKSFTIMEIVAIILELLQITLGSFLNQKLLKTNLQKGTFINYLMHASLGRVIYVLRKFQIGYYLYFLIQNRSSINPIIILVVMYTTILIAHLLAFIFVRGKPFKLDSYPITYLTDTSRDSNKYQQLLQQIQNNELCESMSEEEQSIQVLETDNKPLNTSLLENNEIQDIRWVLIEDHVFDISQLRHPKGQYIMKKISGKDITREIYGLKSMRFENADKNYSKTLKYSHSWKTLHYITNYCIGPIDLPKLLIRDEDISREVSAMSMDMKIFDNNLSVFQKDNLIKFENFHCLEKVNLGQKNQILFIEKKDRQMFFLINGFWIELFGRYFISQQKNIVQYFYYALSLSPVYLKAKMDWLQQLENEISTKLINGLSNVCKEILELGDKFKGQQSEKEKNMLTRNNEHMASYTIPVIKTFRQQNLEKLTDIYFKGPLGSGLGFDDQTTHKYLLLIEDDGILPFLDFFEFLSQRALIQYSNKNDNSHPIFKRDYFYSYCNDVQFYVYWEINENFINAAQTLGIQQLQTIYLTYETQTETSPQKIMQNALLSCKIDVEHVPSIKAQLLNLEEIVNNMLSDNKMNTIDRYIISGSDKFVDKMMQGSNEKRSRFSVL